MEQFVIKISARLQCLPYHAAVIRSGFPTICGVNYNSEWLFQSSFILNGVSSLAYISLSCRWSNSNEFLAFDCCKLLLSTLFLLRSLSSFLIRLLNRDHVTFLPLLLARHILVCEVLQNYYRHEKDRCISYFPLLSMIEMNFLM